MAGSWFQLGTWPLSKGDEVSWKHFEDLRRAIFILQSCLVPKYRYEQAWVQYHTYTYDGDTYNGYRKSDIVYTIENSRYLYWVAIQNEVGFAAAPTIANHSGWEYCADSQKYYHFCKNSLFYSGNYQCMHTAEVDPDAHEYVCHASLSLPTQVWHLTNCLHFSEWATATSYKAGDKIKVTDSLLERDGMICGYICTAGHTSASNNKPVGVFPVTSMTSGSSYWKPYGDPVEVSSESFLSKHSGARYEDTVGEHAASNRLSTPYAVLGGWPDPEMVSSFHADCGYQEYQAAVERVCDSMGWMFETDADYYWADQIANEKPKIAFGSDWRWNCNKSCFEYILKRIDKFVWYWDADYVPTNIDSATHDHQACPWCVAHGGTPANCIDHPVWRRSWRFSMKLHPHLRIKTAKTDSHNGSFPPVLDLDPTGYATSDIVKNHSLHTWHGNPYVEALNDMRLALNECIKLNWGYSATWYAMVGRYRSFPEVDYSDPQFPSDLMDSASAVYSAVDAFLRARMAQRWTGYEYEDNVWTAISGNAGLPRKSNSCMQTVYYGEDTFFAYYPFNETINRIKLEISVVLPPRNASVGGGIQGRTYGLGASNHEHDSGSASPYKGNSYSDGAWTGDGGSIAALTTKAADYFETFHVPMPEDGGTAVLIVEPPAGLLSSSYALPPTCHDEHVGQVNEATAEVLGNWTLVSDGFYLLIDKNIGIL